MTPAELSEKLLLAHRTDFRGEIRVQYVADQYYETLLIWRWCVLFAGVCVLLDVVKIKFLFHNLIFIDVAWKQKRFASWEELQGGRRM